MRIKKGRRKPSPNPYLKMIANPHHHPQHNPSRPKPHHHNQKSKKGVRNLANLWQRIKGMDKDLKRGYVSLIIFLAVLSIAIIVRPRITIQVILVALAVIIMIIGQAKIQDLIAGLILHPIMAMTAGFLIAGAMGLAGGFDVLLILLRGWAEWKIEGFTIFGYIGVGVFLVNIPTIMPMPCGRILAAAVIPGVYLYGIEVAAVYGITYETDPLKYLIILSTFLSAFIVNAAASCGPSPLGGVGGIGEGNMGVPIGTSGKSQACGIMIATGVCALVIALVVKPIPYA